MKQFFTDKQQAVRYFLGELSEREQSAVEDRFFADRDYSLFLDAVENDLIEDYVGGKLDFQRTQNFERNFLISERRRETVRLAQILQTETSAEKEKVGFDFYLTSRERRQPCLRVKFWVLSIHSQARLPALLTEKSLVEQAINLLRRVAFWQRFKNLFRVPNLAWAGGLAMVAILILLGGLWFISSPENNQIAQIKNLTPLSDLPKSALSLTLPPSGEKPPDAKTPQKQLLKSAPKPNLEKREKRQTAPRVAPKPIPNLLPPMQSAEKPLIVGVRNAENIRLRVVHNNAENFIKYRVEIHAQGGDLLWSREIAVNQKTRQNPLALNVRRGALVAGSYGLTLSGATVDGQLEEVNFYNFTVEKK